MLAAQIFMAGMALNISKLFCVMNYSLLFAQTINFLRARNVF